jgi:hypothetical protein
MPSPTTLGPSQLTTAQNADVNHHRAQAAANSGREEGARSARRPGTQEGHRKPVLSRGVSLLAGEASAAIAESGGFNFFWRSIFF